jgi:anaerobic ribonucleoside-triphosphate reductase activating protein
MTVTVKYSGGFLLYTIQEKENIYMNYGEIKKTDIADGIGVRVSLFVSGCTHHCKNCFNESTWDFNYGEPYTRETEKEILAALKPTYITGLTLLGGEPFEPSNQRELIKLLKKVRDEMPDKTVWCYSGYTYEELTGKSRVVCEYTDEMLSMINVLVDGEFVEEKKDIRLKFCGSSNQRIIDIEKTRKSGNIVLWKDEL